MSVDPDQLASERPADQDPHRKVQELRWYRTHQHMSKKLPSFDVKK